MCSLGICTLGGTLTAALVCLTLQTCSENAEMNLKGGRADIRREKKT